MSGAPPRSHPVRLRTDGIDLDGDLAVPDQVSGLVVFAHGSGSSRTSPRNRRVAGVLAEHRLATLLFDLLTRDEQREDAATGRPRFAIEPLARRLSGVVALMRASYDVADHPVGLFGSSTGAAAALCVAARRPADVGAVVSRGGRPDLADAGELAAVSAPTLLIVGGHDLEVLAHNTAAAEHLPAPHRVEVVTGAGHLFTEPGALDRVAALAATWFARHLTTAA